jgi:hypothetical protein
MTTTAEPAPIEPRFTITTVPEPISLFELPHRIQAGELAPQQRVEIGYHPFETPAARPASSLPQARIEPLQALVAHPGFPGFKTVA